MKLRLLLTLAGFAIGFVVPALAQEQNAVDPEIRQQIEAVVMQFDETFKKHDAAAIAALYTPDAVQVWDWMTGDEAVSGQQAIEKRYADDIVAGKTDYVSKLIQVNAVGDQISTISEFSLQVWMGYNVRIYVRDADTWKIHLEYAIHSMRPR